MTSKLILTQLQQIIDSRFLCKIVDSGSALVNYGIMWWNSRAHNLIAKYNKSYYSGILIGSFLWFIGGQTYRFFINNFLKFSLLKINFLPEKTGTFIRFLRSLFNYRPLLEAKMHPVSPQQISRKENIKIRFEDSVDNYWKYFFKKRGWKKRIAYQMAYAHLFPDSILGHTLITSASLKAVEFEHLRSFYRQAYKLPNTLLVLKGNIQKPAVLYGSLERAFSTTKKPKIPQYPEEKIKIANICIWYAKFTQR